MRLILPPRDFDLAFDDLGALTRKGITIDFLSAPGELTWKTPSTKRAYDDLVKGAFEWRGFLQGVASPLASVATAAGQTGIADGIRKLLSMPAPQEAVALLLEVADGGRAPDSTVRAALIMIADHMRSAAGLFAIVGGAALLIPGGQPLVVPFGAAAVVCLGIGAVLDAFAGDGAPSLQEYKDMVRGACTLSGQPPPSDAELESQHRALVIAAKAGSFLKSPPLTKAQRDAIMAEAEAEWRGFFQKVLANPANPQRWGVPAAALAGLSALEAAKNAKRRAQFVNAWKAAGRPSTRSGVLQVFRTALGTDKMTSILLKSEQEAAPVRAAAERLTAAGAPAQASVVPWVVAGIAVAGALALARR